MADDFLATTATTGRVAVGSSATGQLEAVGDRDWFSIILAAGSQYSFKLESGATNGLQDPYLRLFSIGGTTMLAESDDANGLNSQIDITITASGTYYLEAGSGTNPDEQAVGTRMGNYVLSASTTSDDYAGSASTSGRITAGSSATGQLESSGDSDWFAITLTAGKQYAFTLNSGTTDGLTDPLLSLYRSDGTLVTSNDDANGLNSEITYTATGTGTYYLGASAGTNGGGTGTYTLNASLPITEATPVADDDYTATVATTGTVTSGGTASGQLEAAGDSDWFAITLTAGKQYAFTLSSAAVNGLTDPLLKLYRSDGTLVTSNDDFDGLNSQITYTATGTGTYYLGASSGTNGSGTGAYSLGASLPISDVAPVTGDDYTASTSTTGSITVGSVATGQLETAGDSDWFAITLTSGSQYVFTLNAGATDGLADPLLKLYRSDGTLVTSNDDYDVLNSQITVTATSTGTYYLGASSGANGSGTGNYSLAATLVTDDYLATIKTTGQVSAGGSASGQLETSGDSDWFAINLTAGKQYTFSLASAAKNGLPDPFLSLYNSNGVLITSDDNADLPNAAITYTVATSGTYYLGASASLSSTGVAGTGSYTLSSSWPKANGVSEVSGTSVNETIAAGSSDASIDGGAGLDTVAFGNSVASYTVAATAAGYSVSGTDVSDTVTNVESLTFPDGAIKFAADLTSRTPDGSAVRSLTHFTDSIGQRMEQFYLAYYGRSADYGGLVYWKQTLANSLGNDQTKMVGYFGNAQQTEFVGLYGTSNDNTAFLNAVYQNLFSHGSDTAGLNYWLSVIEGAVAGGTALEAARANAVIYILDGAQGSDAAIVNAKVASMTSISQQIATYDQSNVFGDAGNSSAFSVLRNWTKVQLAGTTAPDQILKAVSGKTIANAAVGGNEVQSSVSYTLPSGFTNLKLTGSAALTGGGNSADNLIYGNGAGSLLTGGGGNDCFIVTALSSQPDRVADFASGDLIAVNTAGFGTLAAGVQTVQTYGSVTGTSATLAYDQTSGTLYFDADGTGAQAAQAILTLTGAPVLGAGSVWGI